MAGLGMNAPLSLGLSYQRRPTTTPGATTGQPIGLLLILTKAS